MNPKTDSSSEYLQLLDLVYIVDQSLKGVKFDDFRVTDCEQLVAKIFIHASTVYYLANGTKTPVPFFSQGSWFFDFPSIAVLTRTIFETYLKLFEVFFDSISDDEFEFRHAYWLLSGFVASENINFDEPELQKMAETRQKDICEFRTRIKNTNKFKSLKKSEQERILNGKRNQGWKQLAKKAGFGETIIQNTYSYLSGYVHGDGLSGTQIMSALSSKEQKEYIETNMEIIKIILSKIIINYAKKFPEANEACVRNSKILEKAVILSGAAEKLP